MALFSIVINRPGSIYPKITSYSVFRYASLDGYTRFTSPRPLLSSEFLRSSTSFLICPIVYGVPSSVRYLSSGILPEWLKKWYLRTSVSFFPTSNAAPIQVVTLLPVSRISNTSWEQKSIFSRFAVPSFCAPRR